MAFQVDELTPDKLERYRKAAEAAWGDDTRHEKFAGHPNSSRGQCYVTSKWLTKHLGGNVGEVRGHYVWVSSSRSHVVDLTGDLNVRDVRPGAPVYSKNDQEPYRAFRIKTSLPDTPRAKLFARRADKALTGRHTADLMGPSAYPGETPQAVEEMDQKYLHDEPWAYDNDGSYNFIWGNGQLHVSPRHTLDQLRERAGVADSHAGPFSAGNVSVRNGRARWTVHSNASLRSLYPNLHHFGSQVGWEFDGISGSKLFSGENHYYYRIADNGRTLLAQRPMAGFDGRIIVRGTVAHVSSGRRAEPDFEALREWATDSGFRLAEYPGTSTDFNDKIKNKEWLDTYDRWDPSKGELNHAEDRDPETSYSCPECGVPLGSFSEYLLHVEDHHPIRDLPREDGHFPIPGEIDDPLPAHRNKNQPTVMPLASLRAVSHVEGFDLYSKMWGFDTDEGHIFYGAYLNGECLGYGVVRPQGEQTEIVMVNAVEGKGLGQALNRKICQYHDNVYSHAGSPEGERCLKRSGFVNVRGQKYVYAAGNEPKDMIEQPVPFIYDVQQDHIQIGYPGSRTSDIIGKFTPGGIVEGYYEPGGKVTVQNMTDMPWTVRHMVQLWYWTHPQMEVTGVQLKNMQGETQKLAAQSVGQYIRTLAATDPAAWRAYQGLKAAGGKVYVVGGAVRDALLQKEPHDIDLMVSGLPPEMVEHTLGQLGGSVNLTGKKFGVYRYQINGKEVEIALPRQDQYESGRRGEGQITVDHTLPIEKDLERRDFTANSMAVDLDNGQLIDPHGGAQDIEKRALRTTHPNSFVEDPSRLVRALVASSKHGLRPDERTRQEMMDNAHALAGESPDLLNKELDKLFSSPNPAAAVRTGQETGILHHLFPELAHNFDFDQNNPHHKYTLGEHTLHVLDHLSRLTDDPDVRLAALLHDIGKPASASVKPDGFYRYHIGPDGSGSDHWEIGAQMAHDRLRALRYPNNRINRIVELVNQHMFGEFNSPKGARKFLQRVGPHADDLLNLREADMGGKGRPGGQDVDQMRGLVEQARSLQNPVNQSALSINGNDILGLGVPAGPAVGRILRQLTDAVVDEPSLNDRDTLLQLAQEYHNNGPYAAPPTPSVF